MRTTSPSLPAGGEPSVDEGVPEKMWVHSVDPGLPSSFLHYLAEAAAGDWAPLSEEQRFLASLRMLGPAA